MPNSGGVPIVISQDNLDELAVRLGSPNRLFRTGKVIFQDDFSKGLGAWHPDVGITWDGDHSYHGGFSCQFPAGSSLSSHHYENYAYTNPMGLEFAFAWDTANDGLQVVFGITDDFSMLYRAVLVLRQSATSLWLGVGNSFTPTPVAQLHADQRSFHNVKLTVDFATRKLKTLRIGSYNYDSQISGIPLIGTVITATTQHPSIFTEFRNDLAIGNIYLGQVIITEADE